ncbi:mycofactocin-coupled SDR family oxidoreductase [Rhodococcus jostii]|uniref:Mycofactocin-coupled SDR family oxidoreductase n=1 Tax=Rhodococcus jostii TaxID=132919 RepID=A0ABU4CSM5_RHOJO|nr:mycofactocin-coupled SDR family oxidoreductase [Rhodococcus jostii]MDV6286587.1 mycofactocin-coupled SDR family oxidoreductase [Rhodococcus jostii]
MGKLTGKVAFVTGAARGQGRSLAVRLAEEGADIIAIDMCQTIPTSPFPLATPADLEQTVKLVESLDRRIVARHADVRDSAQLESVVAEGLAELGSIDIVCANAGVISFGNAWDLTDDQWQDLIDTNLTGVWRSAKAAIPAMIAGNRGGSIVLTSSIYGLTGSATLSHYTAAKHGVVGLMKSLALELAPHRIRVNTVNPTFVNTDMVHNDAVYRQFFPDHPNPNRNDFETAATSLNALPTPWVESVDIANAALWLASDDARFVTGISIPVDAGFLIKHNVG